MDSINREYIIAKMKLELKKEYNPEKRKLLQRWIDMIAIAPSNEDLTDTVACSFCKHLSFDKEEKPTCLHSDICNMVCYNVPIEHYKRPLFEEVDIVELRKIIERCKRPSAN